MNRDKLSEIEGTKVLLIDDDPMIRESMTEFLADKGIRLTNCRTLSEAVEELKACCYDILLCDQYLLMDDAANAFECIKNADPGMQKIFFTGAVGVDAVTEAKMEGTVAFIPKPFSAETITDVLFRSARRRSPEHGGNS